MVSEKDIKNKLKEVKDPELNIDIVDMGLIYDIKVRKEEKQWKGRIKMTFTTPACPMINHMLQKTKEKLEEIENFDAEIEVVFDPPWNPNMMSKEAKIKMGII